MKIFPIGIVSANDSSATIDGVSYSMFEPNKLSYSVESHNIIVNSFEKQYMQTRKKSEPYIGIHYEYENIFSREYKQIEHFISSVDDALNSFYIVDWSKGETPSNVTASSGDWVLSISNTRLYSTITNKKSSRAFIWDGDSWKEGKVSAITTNTSITVDVDTYDYGDLTSTNAANGLVYPLYEGRSIQNSLSNFKTTIHVDEYENGTEDGGWMRSGQIDFVGKYSL